MCLFSSNVKESNFKFEKLLVIAGVLLAAKIDKPLLLPRVEKGIKEILNNPSDAFYTGSVMDLMFNGVQVDCSTDDPFTRVLCSNLADQTLSVRQIDQNHLNFSYFGNVS